MSDDKADVVQNEVVQKQPRKRGCLGHCAKFWWAYLLGLIVIVVIVVPVILLVAIPKIAQNKLNEAELEIQSIVVTNTQTTNMTMAIESTIKTDGSVHATIEPFIGDMYLEDLPDHTPFARLEFPETTADAFQTVSVSQFLNIENMAAFTTFNTWLLANESFRVTVKGDTGVRVKGIARRYPVTFQKTVTLKGLQFFKGTTVTNSTINLNPTKNFNATANIPNRSIVTFEIGNATFRNSLFGKEVGEVELRGVTLRPGNDNAFPMFASVQQGPILEALGKKPYCETGGILPFELRGKTVFNHGQPLPYFADALAAGTQNIDIDIGGTLKKDTTIVLPCTPEGGLGGGH